MQIISQALSHPEHDTTGVRRWAHISSSHVFIGFLRETAYNRGSSIALGTVGDQHPMDLINM
jgi:hypothetical protein